MCIYGIYRDDIRFYCFQRRETTISKKNTSNSKHATTKESTIDLNIQCDGIVLKMFYKNLYCYYGTYH